MTYNKSIINNLYSQKKIDALFVTTLNNIRYFSGFTGDSAYLLLTPDKKYFITDLRYKIQSQADVKAFNPEAGYNFIFYQTELMKVIQNLLKKNKIKNLGIEGKNISYKLANELKEKSNVRLTDCSEDLLLMRQIKSNSEINKIKKALFYAEKSFTGIKNIIQPGISEKDIAVELEYQIKKNGADDIAFPIIVASGKNGALPHAVPGKKKLKKNEYVVIDFGAKKDGYHSDITYTINLANKNKLLEKAYKIVKKSVDLAVNMIKIGGKINLVAHEIDDFIKKNGFKDGLTHSLGHGVGLDIHELPCLNRITEDTFKKGMVFTIEPGIYLENIGGVRIEIMTYLTEKGINILNSNHLNYKQ